MDSSAIDPARASRFVIDRRTQSVKHLGELYTVVVGISLALAIQQAISPGTGAASFEWSRFLLFLAFLATIVPFYHGAMRHLDDTYLAEDRPPVRSFALLLDFVLLLTHGIMFVVLSLLLMSPAGILWVLVAILGIDVVWGLLAHLAFSPARENKPETSWAWVNLVTIAVLVGFQRVDATTTHWLTDSVVDFAWVVLLIALVRTLVDYGKNWKFYVPE